MNIAVVGTAESPRTALVRAIIALFHHAKRRAKPDPVYEQRDPVMYRDAQITFDSCGDGTFAVAVYDEHGEGDYGYINTNGLSYDDAVMEGKMFIDELRDGKE